MPLLPIQGFESYRFDTVNENVISFSRSREKVLKWYEYESGIKRVALYISKTPHYIFLSQFSYDDSSSEVVIRDCTRRPRASKKDLPTEEVIESSPEQKEQEELITFFHERENRPMRRDAFISKFSKEILDNHLSETLKEEKTEKGTFYSLIKRLYA